MRIPFFSVEPLEARIAPALAIAGNGLSGTYTDADGDHVTITITKGNLHDASFTFSAGNVLEAMDLSSSVFDFTNLIFSVVRAHSGDGLANVGFINAGANNLGSVVVAGDLGRIVAGGFEGPGDTHSGINSLRVHSLGVLGLDTQGGTGSLVSTIVGDLKSLVVVGDVNGASLSISGGGVKPDSLNIGGSLIGGSADNSGEISCGGFQDISVTIGGSIVGGSGVNSGSLDLTRILGASTLTIGGSLIGGGGSHSGSINAADVTTLKIGHDLIGSTGADSGSAETLHSIVTLNVGGSLLGASGDSSGSIKGYGESSATIGHDVVGGSGKDSGSLIAAIGVDRLTIGGSLIGGTNAIESGWLSLGNIDSLKIGHDVAGKVHGVESRCVEACL